MGEAGAYNPTIRRRLAAGSQPLSSPQLARLHETFGVTVPLRRLFDGSTIRELARALTVELLGVASNEDLAEILAEAEGSCL